MKYIVFTENARQAAELVAAAKGQDATEIVAVLFDDPWPTMHAPLTPSSGAP